MFLNRFWVRDSFENLMNVLDSPFTTKNRYTHIHRIYKSHTIFSGTFIWCLFEAQWYGCVTKFLVRKSSFLGECEPEI